MPILIRKPELVPGPGRHSAKECCYLGPASHPGLAAQVLRRECPEGWLEPGHAPPWEELALVLAGMLLVRSQDPLWLEVHAGQAVLMRQGEWVQLSAPNPDGCAYLSFRWATPPGTP
jgi:hypothetical protein